MLRLARLKHRTRPWKAFLPRPSRRRFLLIFFTSSLILILLFHRLTIFLLPHKTRFPPNDTSRSGHRVTVWRAHRECRGSFHTEPARHSHARFPYAVLRDAVVDRRRATVSTLGAKDVPGTVRIVLYVTMHLSGRLTRERTLVEVDGGLVEGKVEWVHHVTQFLVPGIKEGYKPGMKNKFGKYVTEWQVGVRLQPRKGSDLRAVWDAAKANRAVNMTLPVVRYDEVVIPWQVPMGLGCVMGWTMPGVADREDSCGSGGEGASGAILFSGTALYGGKKTDKSHFREIANFAARALMGPVRYDVVAMGVVSDFSRSDMEYLCRVGDVECWQRLDDGNAELMQGIAQTVEEELEIIGVPRELFSRVLLIPSCRLGSDAARTEWRDPCKQSKRYGQYYASFYSYAILSPFFKWAASYDMDEFLASVPDKPRPPGPAQPILDEADKSLGAPRGDMVFQWLNFRVASTEHSRTLSAALIRGLPTVLRNQENSSRPELCYQRTRDDTAKSAVRCDVGLGFTIHHPVMASPGREMEMRQGNRIYRGLRTWHARLGQLKWAHVADCDYDPSAVQG